MRANCWYGKKDVRVEQVPDPKILNRRDAIVKITSTAICGSDLHLYNGFMPTMEEGDVLGHEFMGEIVEVGPDLKNRKVHDVVLGRSEAALEGYLARLEGKHLVEVVCLDLAAGYRTLVRKHFPQARIVADRFHVLVRDRSLHRRRANAPRQLLELLGRHAWRRLAGCAQHDRSEVMRCRPGVHACGHWIPGLHRSTACCGAPGECVIRPYLSPRSGAVK